MSSRRPLGCVIVLALAGCAGQPRVNSPFAGKTGFAAQIILRQGGREIHLLRQGKEWEVSASTGPRYAADEDQVETLTGGLEAVKVEEKISGRADQEADFEVTEARGRYVGLLGQDGRLLAEGIFGRLAPDLDHLYFRYPGRPDTYLAGGIIRAELGQATLDDWRRHELLSIGQSQMRAITIRGPGYKTDLVLSSGTWTVNGAPADSEKVFGLIGMLARLRANIFTDSSDTPAYDQLTFASIHIQGAHAAADLRIGAPEPVNNFYPVSTGPRDGTGWISEDVIKSILLKPSSFKRP